MTDIQKKIIAEMRLSDCGYRQIAEKTGLKESAVKSFCYRHGLNTEALKNSGGLCKNCGRPIAHKSKTRPRKFCSASCKSAWWNMHRIEHHNSGCITEFVCEICGRRFSDYASTGRKYCSQECYKKRCGKSQL